MYDLTEAPSVIQHAPRPITIPEGLARLSLAVRLRDEAAVGRIVADLAATGGDPEWLARQLAAAGLRLVADVIRDGAR